MITIIDINSKAGYSGCDHLIDDAPLQGLIGQCYQSVRDIRRVVSRIQADTADHRVRHVPIRVDIRLQSGDLAKIDA